MAMMAAFVQRVSGFGFGIFIMTVLPYLMPSYGEATALSGMLALVTSAIIVYKTIAEEVHPMAQTASHPDHLPHHLMVRHPVCLSGG